MKLFRYQNFIKESKKEIDSICRKYGIENYTINEDGSIDVDGYVNLYNKRLTKLPLKFGKVSGGFYCNNNQLVSLEGSPLKVGRNFDCDNNRLTSLEGSPREVGLVFSCSINQLLSLEGSPEKVGADFYCRNNQLTSLEGISKYISGAIYCEINKLRDVRGIKDGWLGKIHLKINPVYEIFRLFPEDRWDEVIEYINEYEVIRDFPRAAAGTGKSVILQRLEQVFIEMGLEVPEIEHIKGYDIQF